MLEPSAQSRMAPRDQKKAGTPKKGGRGGRGRPSQLFPGQGQLSGVLDSPYLPDASLESLSRENGGAPSVPSTQSLMSFALPLPELERGLGPLSYSQDCPAASPPDPPQENGNAPHVESRAPEPFPRLPGGKAARASGQRSNPNQIKAAVSADEAQEEAEEETVFPDAHVRLPEGLAAQAAQRHHSSHLPGASNGNHRSSAPAPTKARSTSSSASAGYGTPAASPRTNAPAPKDYPSLKVQSGDEAAPEPKQPRGPGVQQPGMVRAGTQGAVAVAEAEAEDARGCRVPGQSSGGERGRGEPQGTRATTATARGSVRVKPDTPPGGSSNGREERSVGSQSDYLDSDAGTHLRASNLQEDARMGALLTARWQEAQDAMWPAGMSSTEEEDTESEAHAGLRLRVTGSSKDQASGRRGPRPVARRRGAPPGRDRRYAGMPTAQEEGENTSGTPRAPHTLLLPEEGRPYEGSHPQTNPGSARDCDSAQGARLAASAAASTSTSASASAPGSGGVGGGYREGRALPGEAAGRGMPRGSPYASGAEGRGGGAEWGRPRGSPYASGTEGGGAGGATGNSAASTPRAAAPHEARPTSPPQAPAASPEALPPAGPSSAPESSENMSVLRCASAKGGECVVFLVGTAHVSKESCDEVRRIIRLVKPDVVFLELCPDRVAMLMPQEERPVPTFGEMLQTLRERKANAFAVLYGYMLAKVADKVDILPGAEFRAAYEEAAECGAMVKLGDRPVQVTLRRTWALLPPWHKLKLVAMLLLEALWLPSKSELESLVEQLKQADVMSLAVDELGRAFPSLLQTLITERDLFMAAMLRHVAQRSSAVVAVVGKGHLKGIEENWDSKSIDVKSLLVLPADTRPIFSVSFKRWATVTLVSSIALVVTVRWYRRT